MNHHSRLPYEPIPKDGSSWLILVRGRFWEGGIEHRILRVSKESATGFQREKVAGDVDKRVSTEIEAFEEPDFTRLPGVQTLFSRSNLQVPEILPIQES